MHLRTLGLVILVGVLATQHMAQGQQNLVTNPQMQGTGENQLPPGWSTVNIGPPAKFSIDKAVKRSAQQSVRIEASEISRSYLLSDPIEAAPGEQFRISAWVKTKDVPAEKGTVIVMGYFSRPDGYVHQVAKVDVAKVPPDGKESQWQEIRGTVTVPAQMTQMFVRLGYSYSQGTTWWDDVTVQAVSPVVARIELPGGRLSPGLGGIPVTILNRNQQRGAVRVELTVGKQAEQLDVRLSGEPVQRVTVPLELTQRGNVELSLALHRAGGGAEPIFKEQRKTIIPPPMVLSPPIPTHWAIEDGPATIEGDIDLAVTPAQLNGAVLEVKLVDAGGKTHGQWQGPGAVEDGVIPFKLHAPQLPLGEYRLLATLRPRNGQPIEQQQAWHVIPRRLAKVTLNDDGYPVYDGKPIFPLGIFNGGGRMKEMGESGFTVQHAYNAVESVVGTRLNDNRAQEFMDQSHANGMKVLLLVPRPPLFHDDWEIVRRRIRMFRNHPALLAWDTEEGIARGDMKVDTLAKLYQLIQEEDPHHPLMVGDSRDAINRVTDRSNFFPLDYMDLGMWWWYPIPPGGAKADALQGEEAGAALELAPPTFLTLRNTDKPLWVGVQAYKKPQPWARYPLPIEYRAQAYIAVIHGAKGLMWYGGSVQGGIFTNPEEGNWSYLRELVTELRSMSDVFMAPELDAPRIEPSDAPISLSLRQLPDGLVLMAVNRGHEPVSVTFTSPELRSGEVQVLHENRTVQASDRKLQDTFEGYQTHIYQLPR